MAIDPQQLRPAELVRLLNSTPLGEVISERQLYRHRSRAGFRIGDGRHVDLVRYVAWLVTTRHDPNPEPEVDPYEAVKERAAARNAAVSLAGRDIGELPAVVNPERKARASTDFRYFCESYFPLTFNLAWSPDHLKVIAKIEQAVLHGGLFAMAMPRGSGKTSIAECACLWAILIGHREFVCLIGSDESHAEDMLDSIKTELDGSQLLLEDFPEVCFPIQSLDGIANRCKGQLYKGQRTHIGWTAREIVLPTIPGSKASGAIIQVAGITGRVRGMKFKRADGHSVRPSLVVLDDPQTDDSARSLSQCATRESILAGAVLGLAGPGKKISGIMPCTVIRPGDMADRILDRTKHPQWQGERTKMVYSFPTDGKLWARYAEIRADSLRAERGLADATEFYRQHREEMDAGAAVAWPERFIVMPGHGRYVGASTEPFSEHKRQPGEQIGHHWRIPNVQGKRAVRYVLFDANYWKSFIHARLAVAMGDRGCLSLFGDNPDLHRLLAEHLTAEYRVTTEGRGRTVDEWKVYPGGGDNHWLDCLVGCAVRGSMQGVQLPGTGEAVQKRRREKYDLKTAMGTNVFRV